MRLKKIIGIVLLLVVGCGCASNAPQPNSRDINQLKRRALRSELPLKGSFGKFTIKPGETIQLPDFSFKAYGIIYRYDWPEAAFIIGPSSIRAATLGTDEVDFLPLDSFRERHPFFGGDYEGLRIYVEEIGRDHVVVDIQPYDSVSYTVETNSFATYDLNVGDRLLVPGGYISPREVNHPQGTCRLWHFPDEGRQHGALNVGGRKVRYIDVPGVEFGLVRLGENGVTIEARLEGE